MERSRWTPNDAPEALLEVAQGVAALASWNDLEAFADELDRAG